MGFKKGNTFLMTVVPRSSLCLFGLHNSATSPIYLSIKVHPVLQANIIIQSVIIYTFIKSVQRFKFWPVYFLIEVQQLQEISPPILPKVGLTTWKTKVSSFLATFDAETACIARSFHL